MKGVSCVDHLRFVQNVTNVPVVARDLPVRARLHQFLVKMGGPGSQTQSHTNPQGRLHPSLLDLAKSYKVTHHKLLCKFRQEQLPDGGMTSTYEEKCSRTGHNSAISRVLQQTLPGSKPNNWWRPILDLSTRNKYLKTESFKMETPETIRTSL